MPGESLRNKTPAIAASAAAAVTVTWLSSFAGVSGTLIGVAASSAASGIAVSLYERWIRRVHSTVSARIRSRGQQDPWERYYRPAASARRLDIPWKRAAILTGCALAVSLASVLGAEAVARKPVSAIVTGQPGHGCSVCGGVVAPAVIPSATPVPVVTISPTPSPSLSPSPSPVPSGTPSPSPSASPSPSPVITVSPSPSATVAKTPGGHVSG